MNTLKINDVSLVYNNGYQALNAINLEITNGVFGLLGPNGAGKSSLMKTIVGLQKPSEGEIFFNRINVVKKPLEIQKQLGFLPQYFGVYPKVSAYNLLQHLAKLKGIYNNNERHDQIMNLLGKVNLVEAKNKEVHTFSGGMKQRFGVAQALLGDPKIVIVDEPTAGLDPEERNRFNALLSEIGEDIIILLSTHLVEDVRNLCSEMAIIKQGTIVAKGNPNQFIDALQGKIWQKAINKSELLNIEPNNTIISKQFIEKIMYVTVYADACPTGFKPVTPKLEHAYFTYLNNAK